MSDNKFKTEQESFGAGEFGTEYIDRNNGDAILASNLSFFSKALRGATNITSIIEFGANIGMNLKALKLLYPKANLSGIEINTNAVAQLKNSISESNIHNTSILEFETQNKWDLTLIKGVLIHINPDELNNVYDKLVNASNRYILVAEYYNPSPVAIGYRGHDNKLFKRDFAGEIIDRYPEVNLIDYGFVYHRDLNHPQDDLTWFLLEKR